MFPTFVQIFISVWHTFEFRNVYEAFMNKNVLKVVWADKYVAFCLLFSWSLATRSRTIWGRADLQCNESLSHQYGFLTKDFWSDKKLFGKRATWENQEIKDRFRYGFMNDLNMLLQETVNYTSGVSTSIPLFWLNPLCTSREIWKIETNGELEGKGVASVSKSNPNWFAKLYCFDVALKNMESARTRLLQGSFINQRKTNKKPSGT